MSKAPRPGDEAYIASYEDGGIERRALVIAANPIQARKRLEEYADQEDLSRFEPGTIVIRGVLRDRVEEAQNTGIAAL